MTNYTFPLYDANSTVTTTGFRRSDFTTTVNSWYFQPRTLTTKRKRSYALPVAIGHATFFLALAVAGWLR